ncbi:hypothetical protein DAPPUDRAFT_331992 [Daphnia pulex]|uniref:E3 ubiquitin-protein ligase n=1 Tax=Daphnia pulex TaxID=6669 RepID=E9HNY8_DAPPU|nr:hypothetical protein DAPPUDRAFT_331992 [Daphnia pulex]|eukprot:EFX66546.1 hypothetical protein DAPPUDRAFT_331992 [Daphnia pulex]
MFIISCFHSTPHSGDNFLVPPQKRNQELKDIGIITTGELPIWIPELAQTCTFLFPMKTRKLLFYIKTFERESALQKLKVFSPDSMGVRIAHITGHTGRLSTKQITMNHELFWEDAEFAFDWM